MNKPHPIEGELDYIEESLKTFNFLKEHSYPDTEVYQLINIEIVNLLRKKKYLEDQLGKNKNRKANTPTENKIHGIKGEILIIDDPYCPTDDKDEMLEKAKEWHEKTFAPSRLHDEDEKGDVDKMNEWYKRKYFHEIYNPKKEYKKIVIFSVLLIILFIIAYFIQ